MITSGVCISYKLEIPQGVHALTDTYKLALYTDSANIGPSTTVYTSDAEVSGTGYDAGGKTLESPVVSQTGASAQLQFNDAVWLTSTITARGALLYNATKGNKAVAAYDFGANKQSSSSSFIVKLTGDYRALEIY